jgi:hypothetical protein
MGYIYIVRQSGAVSLTRMLSPVKDGINMVNGRLRGDSYDRYTYSSSLGSSTVDYFITDLNPVDYGRDVVLINVTTAVHRRINGL